MAAYLTIEQLKDRSVCPPEYIDAIEAVRPGWTVAQLEQVSRWIDSRLAKRYAVPFSPPTEAVMSWVQRIATLQILLRRGVDPTDAQFVEVRDDARAAQIEVKEAADSAVGLFDLPLKDSERGSGVAYGGPRVYSEASPYVYLDVQRGRATGEDQNGSGT